MDKWNPPDQGSDWATTQETVPLSNLVSFTHHSPDTWFLQNIVPLDTIPSGICLINLASQTLQWWRVVVPFWWCDQLLEES